VKATLVISALTAGGAERIIISLANHWVEKGGEVTLVTFDAAPPYYPVDARVDLRQLNLPSVSRPFHRAVGSTIRRVLALRRVIRDGQPDIVISFLGKINVLTILATRGMSMPVVVSERNNPDRQVFRRAWRWLRKRLYGMAECVVTPSQGVLNWFPDEIRAGGRVIPNPVDLPDTMPVRQPGQPNLDCPWGPGEILANEVDGLLVPPEDVDALAEAMARLISDAELRQRLGETAQKNVRRFERSQIMTHWDDLANSLISRPR